MKTAKLFVLISILMFCSTLNAQTQRGYVKTKGRLDNNGTVITGTRLSGATVTVKGGNAVVSGNEGAFSLTIPSNYYFLQNVQKQGYVLTDPDVLSRQYAYSKNPLVLVLETPSLLTDDKLVAERKIRRTLQRKLQEKENEIEILKEQQKLSEEEYRKKLQEIYSRQESNEKLISEMADRYSRIDFDEITDFNRRISNMILEGKLEEADSLINKKGDINSRVALLHQHQEANVQTEQEIKNKQKKLEKSKALTRLELEDLAQDCYSKFEIFKMLHQNDTAAFYIKLRASLDTINVEWQLDAGLFIGQYLANSDLEYYYTKRAINSALQQFGEENMLTARCYHRMATISSTLDDVIGYYQKAYNIGHQIEGENSDFIAGIYNNLGDVYMTIGQYSKALEYLEKAYSIFGQLYGENSKWCANVMGIMGLAYNRMNQPLKAVDLYQKALSIFHSSNDIERKPFFIASIYIKLCAIYIESDNQKAFEYIQKAYDILSEIYPDYHPSIGHCYHYFGIIYYKHGDTKKAIDYLNMAIDRGSDIALSYNNIAFIYENEGDLNCAIEYYNKALQYVLSTLGGKHLDAALIYSNIAHIHLKQKKYLDALNNFEKARSIYIETPGNFNYYITEMGRYMYICYHKLLILDKDKYSKRYMKYLQDIIFTARVMSDDCAATKHGMQGMYYLFEFEDWTPDSLFDIAVQIEKYKSKEKTIVVMKDDKVDTIHFNEGAMGLGIVGEYVGKEEKLRIMNKFNNLKKQ